MQNDLQVESKKRKRSEDSLAARSGEIATLRQSLRQKQVEQREQLARIRELEKSDASSQAERKAARTTRKAHQNAAEIKLAASEARSRAATGKASQARVELLEAKIKDLKDKISSYKKTQCELKADVSTWEDAFDDLKFHVGASR